MNKIEFTLRKKCGIYSIINVVNNKKYIGSSKNLYNRLHEHYHNLKHNKAHNSYLQNSWNKYGEDNFIYEIICFCELKEQFIKEQYYLDLYNPEYNFAPKVIPFEKRILSQKEKDTISETLKRRYKNKEIKIQRRLDQSINCYIYDINTFELFGESDCLTKASEMINNEHIGTYKRMKTMIYSNNYIISKIKFKNKIDLINYCYENFFKIRIAKSIYLITENKNGQMIYHRSKNKCAKFNNISKSCLDLHLNATIENPYYCKKSKNKIYFSNIFYPIKKPF